MRPSTPVGWALCAFGALLPVSVAAANVGWALAAGALAWSWARGTRPPFAASRSPLWLPLWAFLAATVAADLLGTDPAHSVRYLNQDAHKVWVAALLSVALAVELPKALPAALLASASALALFGAAQYAAGAAGDHYRVGRAHGFVHPVAFGEQMALLVVGAAAVALTSRGRLARAAAAAAACAVALGLVLSNTRAAIGAGVVGIAAVALALPTLRRWAPLLLGASVVLVAAADLMVPARSIILLGLSPRPLSGDRMARFELWDVAVRMGLDHPLTGVGVNNYRAELPRYLGRVFEDSRTSWGTAHNLYLHQFAERGFVGLAALGWLLWAMARRAWERARARPGLWTLWSWGATAAFLVMNLTEVALQTEVVWLLAWTLWLAGEAEARGSRA
jgi:O-antigen ligase